MSNSGLRGDRLPTDPVSALGPSLFVSILSHLPFQDLLRAELVSRNWRSTIQAHEKGIWRAACHRTECVDSQSLKHSVALENEVVNYGWHMDPEEEEPELEEPDAGASAVDWRGLCQAHVEHERNWRFGRARERYVTPLSNSVWRIKVDHEQGTVLTTSRLSSLIVSDLETSQPLFILEGLHGWAHLEFAKGFVIFDADHDNDTGLYVYRTQPAIARSTRPNPPGHRRPRGAIYGESLNSDIDMESHTGPLPRGHLSFYRQIIPPTDCIAFRARLDNEGTAQERAVLGTAGTEAVYIWDLDDPSRVEKIPIAETDRQRIQYIEFDEDYVFLCSPESVRVYSRRSTRKLLSFPAEERKVLDTASIGYDYDPDSCSEPRIVPRPEARDGFHSTPVSALDLAVVEPHEFEDKKKTVSAFWDSIRYAPRRPGFNACHYTPDDLICTSMTGIILIVRDYRAVLAPQTEEERRAKLKSHTIWLGLRNRVNLLATHGTKVSIATNQGVFFFDTSTLPTMPLSLDHPRSIRVHRICSNHPFGVENAGCLQMDRSNIQLGYCAVGEEVEEGVQDPETGEDVFPVERAMLGLGCVVKIWNFTA